MLLFRYLLTVWSAFVFLLFMLVAVPVYILASFFKKPTWIFDYNRLWTTSWGWLSGVRYNIIGKEKLEKNKAYVFTPNHLSMIDVPIVANALSDRLFTALAKMEVKDIPIMGFLLQQVCVLVNRSDPKSRNESIKRLKKLGEENGVSLILFPEGTRNVTRTTPLIPFHTGAFRLAIDLDRPIVPMVFIGAGEVLPNEQLPLQPMLVTCIILDPIPTTHLGQEDAYALKEKVYKIMEENLLTYDPMFNGSLKNLKKASNL